jgi:hypothetical protein
MVGPPSPRPPSSDPFDAAITKPMDFFSDALANNENANDWLKFDQRTSPRLLTVCSVVLSVEIWNLAWRFPIRAFRCNTYRLNKTEASHSNRSVKLVSVCLEGTTFYLYVVAILLHLSIYFCSQKTIFIRAHRLSPYQIPRAWCTVCIAWKLYITCICITTQVVTKGMVVTLPCDGVQLSGQLHTPTSSFLGKRPQNSIG